jgi:hypothetical protein
MAPFARLLLLACLASTSRLAGSKCIKQSPAELQEKWLRKAPRNASTGRTVLSESPVIELDDNFLSAEEVQRLEQLASVAERRGSGSREWRLVGGMEMAALGPGSWFKLFDLQARHAQQGAAMAWLDGYAWKWTGIRPHPNETLKMSLYRAPDDPAALVSGTSPVHIDVNRKPYRQATVIAYLSDVDSADGGATVFPCIVPPGAGKKLAAKRHTMCKSMASNYMAAASQDEDPFGLWQAADGICKGTVPGLKIQPAKGRAVMFRVAESDAVLPEAHAYHAACGVNGAGSKLNLQIFKELGLEDRGIKAQATAARWNPADPQRSRRDFKPREVGGVRGRQEL